MANTNKERLESLKRRVRARKEREDARQRSVNDAVRQAEEMDK